jgi:hypothetical protein
MTLNFKDIVAQEKAALQIRRQKHQQEHGTSEQPNWFGISLSGGGIRSATINLGFLKTLNKFGILKKSDYLSTVSGGGYTHSYVQATTKVKGDFKQLFTEEHINAMRKHGEYMIPGQGISKNANAILLVVAFLISWAMSLISPVLVAGILFYLYQIIAFFVDNPLANTSSIMDAYAWYAMAVCGGLFAVHFTINIALNFNLGISKIFNRIELILALLGIFLYGWVLISGIHTETIVTSDTVIDYSINAALLFILGFFTNPNALSFHRFYRKQLADLFLRFAAPHENIPLKDLFRLDTNNPADTLAPYPLINTCLNLQNPGGEDKFKGSKASDYFLLSPLYCGAKLCQYVPTERYQDYRQLTLPAAVTISAAAVNPGMGVYSNKVLSIIMTLFNARLGFWISNPLVLEKSYAIVWWPVYFFKELLGRIGLKNKMINISDGGHIENLGAYELLRRGCRLIISVDAGEDKSYSFVDLNNLIIRARNELGLEIRFRPDQQPEDLIRPKASHVYSKQRFAIADIYQWWEDGKATDFPEPSEEEKGVFPNLKQPRKVGTFIYVKSSVTAPIGKPILNEDEDYLKYGTYKYKIYHPDFPHEPTSDQFFDEIQWESYYQLGQYIGADVLGLDDLEKHTEQNAPDINVDQLLGWFDDSMPLFEDMTTRGAQPVAPADKDEDIFESEKGTPIEVAPPPAASEASAPEVKYRM